MKQTSHGISAIAELLVLIAIVFVLQSIGRNVCSICDAVKKHYVTKTAVGFCSRTRYTFLVNFCVIAEQSFVFFILTE